jgi:hypothetical protein
MYYQHDSFSSSKPFIDKGGLIPITAKIFNNSTPTQNELLQYNNQILIEVFLVGYVIEYKEFETRLLIKIWDQTGTVDTIFYFKNETESFAGLDGFKYNNTRMLVKVFGKVKLYKNEKQFQGSKIKVVGDNEMTHHFLQVMNDWMYLGKNDKEVNVKEKDLNGIILGILREFACKRRRIGKEELIEMIFKKVGEEIDMEKVEETIEEIMIQGYLMQEEEDMFEIVGE